MEPEKPQRARKPRRQKAVIDRVEEGAWAVLLVGRKEIEKIVHVDHLPVEARAGTWLKVRIEDDAVRDIMVDAEETKVAKARVNSKLEMLRNRPPHFKPLAASEVQDGSNHLRNTSPSADDADGAPKLLMGPIAVSVPDAEAEADVDSADADTPDDPIPDADTTRSDLPASHQPETDVPDKDE